MFILGNMAAKIKQKTHRKTNKRQTDAVQAAIDYGIDVSMLIENLKRTPAERIRRHQIALNTAEKLSRLRQSHWGRLAAGLSVSARPSLDGRPDERKARRL